MESKHEGGMHVLPVCDCITAVVAAAAVVVVPVVVVVPIHGCVSLL